MHEGKLVFSQLMAILPWRRFDTCVGRYHGDRKIKSFPCSEHWRVMAFAQLTYRERRTKGDGSRLIILRANKRLPSRMALT